MGRFIVSAIVGIVMLRIGLDAVSRGFINLNGLLVLTAEVLAEMITQTDLNWEAPSMNPNYPAPQPQDQQVPQSRVPPELTDPQGVPTSPVERSSYRYDPTINRERYSRPRI